MPVCKKCHTRIDKFNKDICPICGVEKPFEGVSSDTVEITTSIDTSDIGDIDYHPRKRKTLFILFLTLGIFGVPYFYIYRKKLGFLHLGICLLFIVLFTIILYFLPKLELYISIIIAIAIVFVINSIIAFMIKRQPNLKDGRGEFIV